jgi:hypothetical protein
MVRKGAVLVVMIAFAAISLNASKKEATADDKSGKIVDSGSFGIFQRGQRVATETFEVRQSQAGSLTSSQIDTAGDGASQSSELQLTPDGDLVKYLWKELKPEKSESDLTIGDQVILQHTPNEKGKVEEIPYVLPPSTQVLDDYFFVQREILTWKYMASECGAALANCRMKPASFGVIIPRQHTSGSLTIEFKGRDKTDYKGTQQEMFHFLMHVDDVDWSLYLNDQNKLVKVEIPAEGTEAVRD